MDEPKREEIVLESMSDEDGLRRDPDAKGFANGGEIHDGRGDLVEMETGEAGE